MTMTPLEKYFKDSSFQNCKSTILVVDNAHPSSDHCFKNPMAVHALSQSLSALDKFKYTTHHHDQLHFNNTSRSHHHHNHCSTVSRWSTDETCSMKLVAPVRSRDDLYFRNKNEKVAPVASVWDNGDDWPSIESILRQLPFEKSTRIKRDEPLVCPRSPTYDELPMLKECSYHENIEKHPKAVLAHQHYKCSSDMSPTRTRSDTIPRSPMRTTSRTFYHHVNNNDDNDKSEENEKMLVTAPRLKQASQVETSDDTTHRKTFDGQQTAAASEEYFLSPSSSSNHKNMFECPIPDDFAMTPGTQSHYVQPLQRVGENLQSSKYCKDNPLLQQGAVSLPSPCSSADFPFVLHPLRPFD